MKSAVLIGALLGSLLAVATKAPPRDAQPLQVEPPKQESPAPKAPEQQQSMVVAPYFGNEKCPIEGAAIARDRFLEVDAQRVYACGEACVKALEADPAKSLKQAYPDVTPVVTRGCAVCSALSEPDQARSVTFQGRKVELCGAACEKEFRKHPCVWLSRIAWPEAKDSGNALCPIDSQAIDGVTLVIFKGNLIRLSRQECVAAFEKDPESALAKVLKGVK